MIVASSLKSSKVRQLYLPSTNFLKTLPLLCISSSSAMISRVPKASLLPYVLETFFFKWHKIRKRRNQIGTSTYIIKNLVHGVESISFQSYIGSCRRLQAVKYNTIFSVFPTCMVFTLVLTYKPGTVVDEVDRVSDILEKEKFDKGWRNSWKDDPTS